MSTQTIEEIKKIAEKLGISGEEFIEKIIKVIKAVEECNSVIDAMKRIIKAIMNIMLIRSARAYKQIDDDTYAKAFIEYYSDDNFSFEFIILRRKYDNDYEVITYFLYEPDELNAKGQFTTETFRIFMSTLAELGKH